MRVLYFHQHFSTPNGATGTRSYELARRLQSNGHKVTMVCGSNSLADTGLKTRPLKGFRRGWVDGIDTIEISLPYSNYDGLAKRALTFLKFSIKCIRIALEEDYDVLYATSTPLTAGLPGIVMRVLKPRKRFVFEVRDLWPELPKAMGVVTNPVLIGGLWALEQLTYMAMHAGVALSPGIRSGMQRGFGAGKTVALIPNGCDLDTFRPKGTDPIERIDQLAAIPDRGLRCIFSGAHGIANGLDAVLDAARVLIDRNRRDIYLIFIGDGKLKHSLKQRAVAAGLSNCLFLDPVPKHILARLFQKVEIGMMILDDVPAFYEGTSPNKFFDYISTGLPIIINYPGWLSRLVKKSNCGIVVPPNNPFAFSDALVQFADHPALRKCMSQNSRTLAESEFSRDVLAERMVSLLKDVVHGNSLAESFSD